MVGRSHGIHGEPVLFGFKLAIWYEEAWRHRRRGCKRRKKTLPSVNCPVRWGTFAHQGPEIEEYVCAKMGLASDPVSNQIVQRDRHAACASALALLAATIEKITALKSATWQRTEVLEAEGSTFQKGRRGPRRCRTSAKPIASENLCGLARLGYAANSLAALENVALGMNVISAKWDIMPDSHSGRLHGRVTDRYLSASGTWFRGLVIRLHKSRTI